MKAASSRAEGSEASVGPLSAQCELHTPKRSVSSRRRARCWSAFCRPASRARSSWCWSFGFNGATETGCVHLSELCPNQEHLRGEVHPRAGAPPPSRPRRTRGDAGSSEVEPYDQVAQIEQQGGEERSHRCASPRDGRVGDEFVDDGGDHPNEADREKTWTISTRAPDSGVPAKTASCKPVSRARDARAKSNTGPAASTTANEKSRRLM